MKRTRHFRRFSASCAAVAIVFAQLAVAAYSCPQMDASFTAQSVQLADCSEMQSGPTNICHEACKHDARSHLTADVPALPPAGDSGFRIERVFAQVVPKSACIEAPLERATSPPIAIALARFLK
jgi:hypothetical protein